MKQEMNEKMIVNKKNEHHRKERKKNRILVSILCLILGILLGIIGTMLFMGKDSESDTQDNVVEHNQDEQAVAAKDSLEELLEEEAFTIETPNGNLYYPLRWQKFVRVEQTEEEVYTVKFYSALEGKEELELFDVAFGGDEGTLIGTLNDKPVYIISSSAELPDEWTEDEKNVYYTMLEDINYLLGRLEKEEGFVPAT